MDLHLTGRKALVTGASAGIGLALFVFSLARFRQSIAVSR